LLETLALIAYRQPITRGEIEDVRGVSVSSNIMRTLMERGWVRIVGHRDVPGRPGIYATTREFLDYFGLKSLDQLPPLAEVRDLESIGVELDLELADLPVLAAEQLAEADDEAPAWPPEEAGDHEEATDADPQQDSSRP
jgi:segregation and condensation protein B